MDMINLIGKIGRKNFLKVVKSMKDAGIVFDQKTKKIIGVSFEVMNEIGSGFLESVYHQSFAIA